MVSWYTVMVKYARFGEPKNFTFSTVGSSMSDVSERIAAQMECKEFVHFSNETLGIAIPSFSVAEIQVHRRDK